MSGEPDPDADCVIDTDGSEIVSERCLPHRWLHHQDEDKNIPDRTKHQKKRTEHNP